MLDPEDCKALIAFAQTRSFTLAARELGVSQPSLFERIKRLSEKIGVPLYEKSGRALSLTSQGTRLTAFAQDALRRTSSFISDLRGEGVTETAILAAGEGAFLYLLGPALTAFRRREKTSSLRLLTLGGPTAIEALQDGTTHLAVGVVDLLPEGIEARVLRKTPLCAALSSKHPLAKKAKLTLRELSTEALILPPKGRSHRDFIGRALSSLGEHANAPIEADGWPLMLQFAALNLGVAVVNGICQAPKSVVLRPIPELGTVTYRLFMRRGSHLPECVKRLFADISDLT
jgi:LysR family transcriptional regulator, low CO2-responsive transcriptional regulator